MKVKTLFISDCHLGLKKSNHLLLLNLIRHIECENIYIVGDFIDGWALKKKFTWENDYNIIIQKLLKHTRKGVKLYYLWGNHDNFLSSFNNVSFGDNITICREIEYLTTKNKRYIVLHGDIFDCKTTKYKWLYILGCICYNILLKFDNIFKFFNLNINKIIKNNVKHAVKYIKKFEDIAINYTTDNKYDGIILGHIHHPASFKKNNIHYVNTGDFIDSNTCVIEDLNGNIKLLNISNENLTKINI